MTSVNARPLDIASLKWMATIFSPRVSEALTPALHISLSSAIDRYKRDDCPATQRSASPYLPVCLLSVDPLKCRTQQRSGLMEHVIKKIYENDATISLQRCNIVQLTNRASPLLWCLRGCGIINRSSPAGQATKGTLILFKYSQTQTKARRTR